MKTHKVKVLILKENNISFSSNKNRCDFVRINNYQVEIAYWWKWRNNFSIDASSPFDFSIMMPPISIHCWKRKK